VWRDDGEELEGKIGKFVFVKIDAGVFIFFRCPIVSVGGFEYGFNSIQNGLVQ